MKKLITILLISLLVLSCKKNRTLHFTGKVVNAVTGEGIEGIEMKLIETSGPSISDPFSTQSDDVKTLYSDVDGSFEFVYTGWNRKGYYILTNLDYQTHDMIGWQDGGDEIKNVELEEINDNLEIVPMGRFSSHIKNVNCQGADDSMHVELTYLLTGVTYINNNFQIGCYEQYGVSSPIGIGDYRHDWYFVRNGLRTDSVAYFSVFENDTTHTLVYY